MSKKLAPVAAILAILSVSSAASAASTDGKNRKVLVQNVSSQTISNLYASPIAAKTWEEDLLGSGTIPPGTGKNANIDNGTNECHYDLKVIMADKSEHVKRDVNVCASSKWVIGDSGDELS
jgi:hypothetical protein